MDPITEWVVDYGTQLTLISICILFLLVLFDIWLVKTKRKTISYSTWIAVNAHPAMRLGGCIASIGICFLVQDYWWAVGLHAFISGHLFASNI